MFSSCDSDKRTGFERLSLIGGVWLTTAYFLSNMGGSVCMKHFLMSSWTRSCKLRAVKLPIF